MKRARFTEEQIIAVLKVHEAGAKTADLARKHGISEATFYNWKIWGGALLLLFNCSPPSNSRCLLINATNAILTETHRAAFSAAGLTI
jgi:putative transposase